MRAGVVNDRGYVKVRIAGRAYSAHRLAYLYMTGEWPKGQIDHKDLNKANNAWANLRQCLPRENLGNRGLQANNTSGLKGVSIDRRRVDRPFRAFIAKDGKNRSLGSFRTADEAHAAYCRAAEQQFGEFARGA
jgi:hypothetical protein